jgi:hypothetical protein
MVTLRMLVTVLVLQLVLVAPTGMMLLRMLVAVLVLVLVLQLVKWAGMTCVLRGGMGLLTTGTVHWLMPVRVPWTSCSGRPHSTAFSEI